MKKIFFGFFFLFFFTLFIQAQRIEPGAEQFDQYLPPLMGMRVGVFANQTTVVYENLHLVDAGEKEDLAVVDILVFDIQDVGIRFYTYISSPEEFMKAAIAKKITRAKYLLYS